MRETASESKSTQAWAWLSYYIQYYFIFLSLLAMVGKGESLLLSILHLTLLFASISSMLIHYILVLFLHIIACFTLVL